MARIRKLIQPVWIPQRMPLLILRLGCRNVNDLLASKYLVLVNNLDPFSEVPPTENIQFLEVPVEDPGISAERIPRLHKNATVSADDQPARPSRKDQLVTSFDRRGARNLGRDLRPIICAQIVVPSLNCLAPGRFMGRILHSGR